MLARCDACGRECPRDVTLCRAQWLSVCPEDRAYLCAACMVERAPADVLTVHLVFARAKDYEGVEGPLYAALAPKPQEPAPA